MKGFIARTRLFNVFIVFIILLSSGSSVLAQNRALTPAQDVPPTTPVVAQVYFYSAKNLNQLASYLDIWEVNHPAGYLVAMLSPQQFAALQDKGFPLLIDQGKTKLLGQINVPLPSQGPETIPGYSCYRTVEETYTSMQNIAAAHPDLAIIHDFGDSWDKKTAGGPAGYDLYALELSNQDFGVSSTKPTFFLMAEIHAREYTTAETAMRFAEYLIGNYGKDPDITWLLDYFRIFIVPMTNPDGRKFAEQAIYWRKNTNTVSGGGCSFPSYGIDLNRSHSFHWGEAGTNPCDETYQGSMSGSEPETQAIQSLVVSLFPDQRGPNDTDPAPITTTGTLITLHSYQQLVLWPWGWSYTPAPNNTQLQTLGRHLSYFNNYTAQQAVDLYPTTGSSDDWSYGLLGVASYTFEMGTDFFQSCSSFESTVYPNNRNALVYAFKTARRPYMNPAGPDSLDVAVTPNSVPAGTLVSLTATANDTRYNSSYGTEPIQNIGAASYSINDPSWIPDTMSSPMAVSDGSFNENIEDVQASIDTTGLSVGQHTIFVESMDVNGNWGVPSAVFLNIIPGAPIAEFSSDSPVQLGQPVHFSNQTTGSTPITYAWDFGDDLGFSTGEDPVYTYSAPGEYTVILTATNELGTDSISHTLTVNPTAITSVDLSRDTSDPIYRGNLVQFTADLTPDTGNTAFDFTFDFGDKIISGLATSEPLVINHGYALPGSYTVQVWIKNAGMVDPVTDSIDMIVFTKIFLPLTVK